MTVKLSDDHRWLIVNERRWPVKFVIVEDVRFPFHPISEEYWYATRICRVMTESGWEASVIWGHMTYSDNYHAKKYPEEQPLPFVGREGPTNGEFTDEPTMVEVALFRHDREDMLGDPAGWVTGEELNVMLDRLLKTPSDYDGNWYQDLLDRWSPG